jgi:hypothetical protein
VTAFRRGLELQARRQGDGGNRRACRACRAVPLKRCACGGRSWLHGGYLPGRCTRRNRTPRVRESGACGDPAEALTLPLVSGRLVATSRGGCTPVPSKSDARDGLNLVNRAQCFTDFDDANWSSSFTSLRSIASTNSPCRWRSCTSRFDAQCSRGVRKLLVSLKMAHPPGSQ